MIVIKATTYASRRHLEQGEYESTVHFHLGDQVRLEEIFVGRLVQPTEFDCVYRIARIEPGYDRITRTLFLIRDTEAISDWPVIVGEFSLQPEGIRR